MKFCHFLLIISLLISLKPPLSAEILTAETPDGRKYQYLSDQILVKYKTPRSDTQRTQLMRQLNTKVLKRVKGLNVDVLQVPEGQTVESFIEECEKLPDVEYAEPNGIFKARLTVNDPSFSSQDYLQSNLLNMEAAWDITTGVSSVVVAVIDTGVDIPHPDLSANVWVNSGEIASNSVDDDGNGFVDDINGWDFVNNDNDPDDDGGPPLNNNADFHGTHAAGLIGAVTNNGLNIAGVAHNTRFMAIKVLADSGSGTTADVANGILYASNNGASVINLSLGSDANFATVASAVNTALANNVVVVAAAGNTDLGETSCAVEFPGAQNGVIAVGATDSSDVIAAFSCNGPEVDLSAPGVSILSLTGANPPDSPSGVSALSGTSFACPLVAGVAALMRSLNPTISVTDVNKVLTFNAKDLGAVGFDNFYGFGRMQPLLSLQAVRDGVIVISNPASPGETFPFPNPYNPLNLEPVTISIPASLGSAGLQIQIFNIAGERVKTLTDTNTWDGRNDDGSFVASGLYLYVAKTSAGDIKGKLTIIK